MVKSVSPEWLKEYFSAKDKIYKATNAKYAVIIRKGYGNPVLMREILSMLLSVQKKEADLNEWNIGKNGKLFTTNTEVEVLGVTSSVLKGNGWCESIVRVVKKYGNPETLMIRTQIAPDGTPLFIESFAL